MPDLATYLRQHHDRHLEELLDFLRIPSVSTHPDHAADVAKAAEFVHHALEHAGLDAEIMPTAKHPAVYAEKISDSSKPTVLIYGHYDVQPVDPLELWESPPFEPTIREGSVYARGASDDKGQMYAHIKGVEALLASSETLPVNIKFLLEGEEEIGSPNLEALIEANLEKFAADVVLVSDNSMIAPNTPTITYGLKGLAYIEVQVKAAAMDLHSGAYGGGVPNPINVLAKMIAALHDDDGRVTVPGFYDAVLEISDEERAAFARVPFEQEKLSQQLGLKHFPGEAGYSLLERLWARPTLDCNGIGGGFQGEGAKTVIPSEASAKISCRLVPNQTPAEITQKLSDYLLELAPESVQVTVKDLHGGMGALTPIDAPAVQISAEALREVYEGSDVIFARTGGSIPVVATFQAKLEADVVMIGFGLEDDRVHSPNEKFNLENYRKGIEISATVLRHLANLPH